MRDIRRIDLHTHSTVSDGTDTPAQLLQRAKDAGLWLFALTDHDAFKGYDMLRDCLEEGDPRLLSGVEFSCRDALGKYHILGYDFDPSASSIREVVEMGHRLRMEKVQARLEHLKTAFGFTFPREEIEKLLALDNPGKPHIGNLMVRCGYAKDKEEAINVYIDSARIKSAWILPQQAIEGILGAGGLPVLAHPAFGSGGELIVGDALEERVRRLMGFGLKGIEAFYSSFPPKLRTEALRLAEKYDLLVTAGSDYHGKNKLVALGDTTLDQAGELPAGLVRFLEETGAR